MDVKSYQLDNGLTVWLNEDHTQASVFGAVVVKAGAKDSPATGIAHYFEHIMFKGTDKIGTTDYNAEKVYLDSIAAKYDMLAQTADEAQRGEIQKEINRLSIEAARFVIPNEFSTLVSQMGGSGLNAGTGFDQTIYYNIFVPQYINQWLELNSERLINPVFRLFQSELETVYEEKNMYSDQPINLAFEKLIGRIFQPHPYQYPIVGLTEHLKNPKLSDMEQFYRDYYRAGNMGLILSGDFDTEAVMPVIKEKFGRVAAGSAPSKPVYEIPPFKGKETIRMLVPIPVVKIAALAWHGVPTGSPDEPALNVTMRLLSNSSGTGSLDLLGANGKLLAAQPANQAMSDAGVILTLIIPKLMFQSYDEAEKLVINEINHIKNGDFTDEALESAKLEMRREFETQLETSLNRAQMMFTVFAEGKDWNDYLAEMEAIAKLTRDDIVKVANSYLTADYLSVTKKTGSYDNEKVVKPDFAPIVPPNRNQSSTYAKKLVEEASANLAVRPRTIDFERDVESVKVAPLVTLYAKTNPINDIFRLQLSYRRGNLDDPMVNAMSGYLNDLPTDSLTYKEFKSGLQKLGATVYFGSHDHAFEVLITGFDENIEPTLQYVSHFMQRVQPDKNAHKRVVSAEKMNDKSSRNDPETIADALFQYVVHGKASDYFTLPSAKDIKKKGKEGLLDTFRKSIDTECDIFYSGKLSAADVSGLITRYFEPDKVSQQAAKPIRRMQQRYNKPVVFVIDNPKAKQSVIYSYTPAFAEMNKEFMCESGLFNTYFGGGMSSILFQEIREFRSLSYGASSQYNRPGIINGDKPSYMKCYLATQSDKTVDAISVLDSLLNDMPQRDASLLLAKQTLRNNISNACPSFRAIPAAIANMKRNGFSEDGNAIMLNALDGMDMQTVTGFHTRHIKGNTTCYIVAGNMKQVNMEQLKQFGEVRVVKVKEVFK